MIREITQYIEDNTSFVIGTDLFSVFRPAEAQDDCLVIIPSGGTPNFYLTDLMFATVHIISRAGSQNTANENSQTIYNLLHGRSNYNLPVVNTEELKVGTGEALNVPQSIGQDGKGLFEYSTNYVLRILDVN